MLRPSAGKVLVDGTDISRIKESELGRLRSGTVASLLQGATPQPAALRHAGGERRVRAQGAHARRAPPAPCRRDALLDALGMGDLAGRPLAGMSGGEKQRVAFASAVSSGAGLLLADEPTSQLSHDDRDAMVELIHVVNREFGTTVVLVTHDPEVAAQMPRSITIRNGRIGSEGRHGFDFGVVDEDGAVHIPDDLATRFPAGTLVQFEDDTRGRAAAPRRRAGGAGREGAARRAVDPTRHERARACWCRVIAIGRRGAGADVRPRVGRAPPRHPAGRARAVHHGAVVLGARDRRGDAARREARRLPRRRSPTCWRTRVGRSPTRTCVRYWTPATAWA